MPTIEATAPKIVILDATHRCDGCGSQAYVRVLTYYGVFEYCVHHWHTHADAMAEIITADILDESWRLDEVAKLDVSA
jgi:hypothetical protein